VTPTARYPAKPFLPGNHQGGRPPGVRNKTTNLVVSGITAAILDYGREYAFRCGLPPDADPETYVMSDVDAFKNFIRYCIERDLRAVIGLIKPLIPRDVTLTIAQTATVEVLAPQALIDSLERRGLRLPPAYQLTAGHRNDDDQVTEAEIAAVLDPPSPSGGDNR
jgi:hypothetical protein